jgi:hypothetical protein
VYRVLILKAEGKNNYIGVKLRVKFALEHATKPRGE